MKELFKNYNNSFSTCPPQLVLILTTATLVLILVNRDRPDSGLIIAVSVGVIFFSIIFWLFSELLNHLKLAKRDLLDTRLHLEERVQQGAREQESLVKELKDEIKIRRKIEDALTSLRKEEDIRQREKLAAELHDIIGLNLQSVKLLCKLQQSDMKNGDLPELESQEQLIDEIDMAIKHVRQMTNELHPIFLENMDILEAIRSHNDVIGERIGPTIIIENDHEHYELDNMIKEYCFLIYREALNNIVKHANATQVSVKLMHLQPEWLQIEITDNGKGFDIESIEDTGHGLVLIQNRTRDIGGSLNIKSIPGEGTCVYIKVPCYD